MDYKLSSIVIHINDILYIREDLLWDYLIELKMMAVL